MLPTLVLAAGLGSRLDPLTRIVAKPAVPLGGYTLIERILYQLAHHGITDVVVNLHHHPASVTSVIGDGSSLGLRVRYSWEPELLGSAGGPRRALPLLDAANFFIVNGDTLSDIGLAPVLGTHASSGADVTLAVVPNAEPDRYNGIVLDEDHGVLGFVPKGQAEGTWHYVGVQIVQARVFLELADGVSAETIAGLYREIIDDEPGSIRAHVTRGTFRDVGTPRDYLSTALHYAGTTAPGIEPGARVDPTASIRRSVVWREAEVGAGVTLDDCIVAGAARVPAGLSATGVIIIPETYARDDDDVERRDGVALFPLNGPAPSRG